MPECTSPPEPAGSIDVLGGLAGLDGALAGLPNQPAVFLLWPREGEPYLARTALLRRRLLRLLAERGRPSRFLNLRGTVSRLEYWLTGSSLESWVRMCELARKHFPKAYLDLLHLRMPPYVKIVLANPFPRSQITTHLGRTAARYYGPFRSRASAERFEAQFLDLFQMRRCQEDLVPSPAHPGCIYGEMGMCLRPCQQAVGGDEYAHEVSRVVDFLATDGRSLITPTTAARDGLSQEMQFEAAAREHKRLEKIQEVLKLRDGMARDIERLHGVAVTRSGANQAVELWFVQAGYWLGATRITFEVVDGKPVSLDQKLRESAALVRPASQTLRERQEYLAILARWFYSSWRDGEWLEFESLDQIPYRKLVHAISRVAR
jgi:excinuclease ABC subunit C